MDMWVSVPGRGTCTGQRMADARCSRGSKEAGEAQAEKWVGGVQCRAQVAAVRTPAFPPSAGF